MSQGTNNFKIFTFEVYSFAYLPMHFTWPPLPQVIYPYLVSLISIPESWLKWQLRLDHVWGTNLFSLSVSDPSFFFFWDKVEY